MKINDVKFWQSYFPIFSWLKFYNRELFLSDLVASIVVTIMLIPQSLAYAMLAGLPAETGLYASILPLIAYTVFGTSRTLAVGPVAVASLMTAAAIGQFGITETGAKIEAAIALAALSGMSLILMGLLRLGFLANFLSHPVITGFITASGIVIAASQVKHILGVQSDGDNIIEILGSLYRKRDEINVPTMIIGVPALFFLFWVRKGFKPFLENYLGFSSYLANLISKTGPVIAVIIATSLTAYFSLNEKFNVSIVGEVPSGIPMPHFPDFNFVTWKSLALPAFLISVIGYVETISIAQTLAAKRRQRINPDQELIALGMANCASAFSTAFPVTGGFARSVVNFESGAQTPMAGAMTAIGIAFVTVFLTPLIEELPKAVLGATIIVAVLSLINIRAIKHIWDYSKSDFAALCITILATLSQGVEIGIILGVSLSILLHLIRTARPHYAIVGQLPGTEYFRNVKRHSVLTKLELISLRIDESLYFPNARFLEDIINQHVADNESLKHVILQCSAVNSIDSSALESLEAINGRLKLTGIKLHLTEVKGPVMDRLKRTDFPEKLTGNIWLTQYQAVAELSTDAN